MVYRRTTRLQAHGTISIGPSTDDEHRRELLRKTPKREFKEAGVPRKVVRRAMSCIVRETPDSLLAEEPSAIPLDVAVKQGIVVEPLASVHDSPDVIMELSEVRRILLGAVSVKELDLLLSKLSGMTDLELAEENGVTQSRIRRRIQKAMKRLRESEEIKQSLKMFIQ